MSGLEVNKEPNVEYQQYMKHNELGESLLFQNLLQGRPESR